MKGTAMSGQRAQGACTVQLEPQERRLLVAIGAEAARDLDAELRLEPARDLVLRLEHQAARAQLYASAIRAGREGVLPCMRVRSVIELTAHWYDHEAPDWQASAIESLAASVPAGSQILADAVAALPQPGVPA